MTDQRCHVCYTRGMATKRNPDADPAASALAAKRRRVEKPCAVCGTPMVGIRTKRYCSNACNLKGYRAERRTAGGGEESA
jgi:hypothetical protein